MAGAVGNVEPNFFAQGLRQAIVQRYRREGWRAVGDFPPNKCVIIAAPHTSNWDFVNFLGLTNDLGFMPHFMAKRQLFRWPMGGFMRAMGGVEIDRSKSNNVVDAMTTEFARRDVLRLVIAAEGTRNRVEKWKTGFYHIALAAKVPIIAGFMDYQKRIGGLGPSIMLSGDYAADMAKLLPFYASVIPCHPEQKMRGIVEPGDLDGVTPISLEPPYTI